MRLKTLVFTLALALAGCATEATPASPTRTAQVVAAPLPAAEGEWTEVAPQAVNIGGRVIEATCSGAPGSDPAYRFWAKRGRVDALVVYFEGGGACWDDVTCAVPRLAEHRNESDGFYKAELIPGDTPERMSGIFDLNNPRNPLREWSFVYVPYCTGDVHAGANTTTYTDPDTGEPYTIQHRGADNFRVVLEWMRANFQAPSRILVAGSSGGAYGAATNYGRVRDVYPRAQMTLLSDAGQGVTTPGFLDRRNANWRYDLPASVFGRNAQLTDDDDLVSILARHYPADRFAQYTTAHDVTQIAFFALMGAENACASWTSKMASDLAARERSFTNFRAYLASGESHAILRSPHFYREQSGGAPFAEWLGALVGEGNAAWENHACTECMAPPRRCRF